MENISPEQLKQELKKFALGGGIMPVDVTEELDVFKKSLEDPNVSDVDKEFFRKAIANIEKKYISQTSKTETTETEIPDVEVVEAVEILDGLVTDLYSGNWYKKYPQKLLGITHIDTDRYGKEIRLQKGNISVLENIDVQTDFGKFIQNRGIGTTYIKDNIRVTMIEPEVESFVENIIQKSEVQIGKKAIIKHKKEIKTEQEIEKEIPIQTYKDIYKSLNKNISNEELKVYVWYKESIGQKLSKEWYDLAYEIPDNRTEEQKKLDWISSGILFYHNGEFLPLPLFCSGNIYEKVNRLVKVSENSGQDVDFILKNYGERVLQIHIETLNLSFDKIYKNRLLITGNEDENSLILKPISKFAKNFKVSKIESFEEFKWWVSKGKPDFLKTDGSSWKKETFETLSLTDAFSFWLAQNKSKLDFRGNISFTDIIYFYIQKRTKQAPDYLDGAQLALWKAQLERTKAKSASEGNRLFLRFLKEELSLEQKVAVETNWNAQYNNYLKPDYSKIPVAFNITNRFFGEEPFEVKEEKREAVSFIFNEGSGCLAYDVGVGKSLSAIMIMEQFIVAGYCKRPFLVVPNQTYKQWLSEIKNALPHRKVNGLFNLGVEYSQKVKNDQGEIKKVDENSISVLTYEGFLKLGFNEETQSKLMKSLYEILNQGGASELMSEKKKAGFFEKLEGLVGRGLKGTNIEIESLGFDFVCYDEAHALKKIFTSVKGEIEEGEKKARKSYDLQSGLPSDTALKGFMISNYILKNNNDRNILLLTATPFTNSPLEVFSMLSLVAYHHLSKLGIINLNDFFDNYIDVQSDLVINHKLKPQYKQIVKGFNNLPSLQKIIFRFFNYKDGDDVGVIRPNKIVIPLTKKLINGEIVRLSENEQVTSSVEMSPLQKKYMEQVIEYAEGKGELNINTALIESEEEVEGAMTSEDSDELSDDSLSNKEKQGVRALRAMNFSRNIALSPYLYEFNTLGKPTASEYVNTSPKLKYVMECIRSVKEYHELNNEPVSGQVIYMDRGLDYFNLLKEYLISDVGFQPHEIGEITARMSTDKKRMVQDSFLGRYYDEKEQDYFPLDDSKRIKVLLGSSSIKEGINLQTKSTVLYNCFLDWNPTDIIQLEGRIWRQKNEFMNVRIVNPLVIDSIDIFMFQKLEEKTARINSIWSTNNKSVFKLEEIDPEEIKFALIKDPKVIASLEVETKSVKIQDEIASLKTINERLTTVKNTNLTYSSRNEEIDNLIKEYFPSKIDSTKEQKINALIKLFKSDFPKDDNGLIILSDYQKRYEYDDIIKKYSIEKISPLTVPYQPWWFSMILDSKRILEKETRDLLNPRNIQIDKIEDAIQENKIQIEKLEEDKKYISSDDYINKRSDEITEIRLKNKIKIKSIQDLVQEFNSMNYLLSLKRVQLSSILSKLSSAIKLLN